MVDEKPKKKPVGSKSRNYMFTYNNPPCTLEDFVQNQLRQLGATCGIAQMERGEGTEANPDGTIHIQAYARY